jgi:NAD(P) transhydrogenase subunit alpha
MQAEIQDETPGAAPGDAPEARTGPMKIGVPTETRPGERRVAVTPETVGKLIKLGFAVQVEAGAGLEARIADADFAAAGAEIVDAAAVWSASDLVVKVAPPTDEEADQLREGASLASLLDADERHPLVARLAARKATFLALDAVPRISRAQTMDIRSSMANLAGYRAVIESAIRFGRTLGAQVTAAGSTPPAKVLIIGAGVAGLAAVAAARGLGAVVRAFDTREACREQVQSLGAEFLTVAVKESGDGAGGYAKEMSKEFIDAEMALFRKQAREVDVVITTALIPNRPAPKLWLTDMVESMRPGSVVVDLASPRGGNCELTVPGEDVVHAGVTIVGETDLTQRMADHASRLFARNVLALLTELGGGTKWSIDLANPITRGVTVLEGGELRWPAPPPDPSPAPPAVQKPAPLAPPPPQGLPAQVWVPLVFSGVLAVLALARWAPAEFLQHFTVFVLACIIGWQVIWNVTPALHTPLMSVTNAISGIILIGGVLQLGSTSATAGFLGFLAILLASINVFGGFAVTQRMLGMFRRHGEAS